MGIFTRKAKDSETIRMMFLLIGSGVMINLKVLIE